MREFMTVKQIAALCGVAERTVRDWIASAESAELSAKSADGRGIGAGLIGSSWLSIGTAPAAILTASAQPA